MPLELTCNKNTKLFNLNQLIYIKINILHFIKMSFHIN